MQVLINSVDVTSCVQESTYKVDLVDEYKSWIDGAGIEHRTGYRSKVRGTFDAVFLAGYSMEYSVFKAAVDAATTNKVLTLSLTVNNLDGELKTINAFYNIEFHPMRQATGAVYKRATITIDER